MKLARLDSDIGRAQNAYDVFVALDDAGRRVGKCSIVPYKADDLLPDCPFNIFIDLDGELRSMDMLLGAALPPLIIISIISSFYQAFRSNKYVSMAMAGMLAGVAAVIFDVVINMAWPILKKKRLLPIAVMLAAFVATRFFSVNIILIILVCGVIGALDTLYLQKKEAEE